jgi:hypothetical protein
VIHLILVEIINIEGGEVGNWWRRPGGGDALVLGVSIKLY